MANWAIGDVQGCCGALQRLLTAIKAQDPLPHFYFCGDLINRGEDSLGTLQLIQTLGDQAHTVLGNHDLYALGCAAGFLHPKNGDTLTELLAQPHQWVDWLRCQPLAIDLESTFLITHAGVWHEWHTQQTLQLAQSVQNVLQADDWAAQLQALWQGNLRHWQPNLSALDQQRFTINALMRMRLIAPDGGLDFLIKESLDSTLPTGYVPWFQTKPEPFALQERIVVFGHWSALGLRNEPRLLALDTGCVWGRCLTAVELVAQCSWRRIIQVPAMV